MSQSQTLHARRRPRTPSLSLLVTPQTPHHTLSNIYSSPRRSNTCLPLRPRPKLPTFSPTPPAFGSIAMPEPVIGPLLPSSSTKSHGFIDLSHSASSSTMPRPSTPSSGSVAYSTPDHSTSKRGGIGLEDISGGALRFQDTIGPNRTTTRRRPLSGYPTPSEDAIFLPSRKHTDPTPHTPRYDPDESPNMHQELDVDLNAYSTEFDGDEGGLDSRAPTLSFVTTSTVESAASTPPMGIQYGFRPDVLDSKADLEPRVRMRTTTGRSNAYSSAESSMASGAYSVHGYNSDQIYHHPHPPPLPSMPNAFASPSAEHVGLGINSHDIVIPDRRRRLESPPPSSVSPSQSFGHRPWHRDHLRTDSGSSSITSNSSENEAGPSQIRTSISPAVSSYPFGAYSLDERLPWERESSGDEREAKAVAMVIQGKERILDAAKLEAMGGVDALTETKIETLAGITHLILPGIGSSLLHCISSLLLTLAPSLVVLDLSNNDLSFLPESLRQCGCLEELNVSGNPMRQIPTWLSEVTSLRVLAVDRCGLSNLPADLARLSSLHTICARENRLPSLPSWLCLLSQLETLRVDGNPFAPEWMPVVAPILTSSAPPRAPIMSAISLNEPESLREAPSIASLTSSMTASSISHSLTASNSLSSIRDESYASARGTSTLGPIAEDHQPHPAPHSAPLRAHCESPEDMRKTESITKRGLRRMRSAGALLDQHIGLHPASQSTTALVSPAPSKYTSLGASDSRRILSIVGESNDVSPLPSPLSANSRNSSGASTPNGQAKDKKWGFLRKMSMNRLRGDKSTMSTSASANIKLMPPPMQHQHSAPTLPLAPPVRPVVNGAKSASTLPTRKLLSGEGIDEFGQTSRPTSPTTLPSLLAPPSIATMFGEPGDASTVTRAKRRSFLALDGPPLINITIPSTSPFMPSTAMFPSDDASIHRPSMDHEDLVHALTSDAAVVESPAEIHAAESRYSTGLESIKSYLRDLYDLSRPPIEPYGGFEVLEGSPSASPSETLGSPNSITRNSVSEARRARALTMEGSPAEDSRHASQSSANPDVRFSTAEVETSKKFKNDRSKRAKVIREIYETERTYVRGLGELVSIYVKPASQPVKHGQSETVIPAAERKVVFGGVESILTIHRDNLLRALETAVRPLLEGVDDEAGHLSTQTAHQVGEVFRTYIAYMKQYSTYINNFDNALSRMKTWTASTLPPPPTFNGLRSSSTIAGLGAAGMVSMPSLHLGESAPHSGNVMTAGQRKRVKVFLKKCRDHAKHSQINLESYLLLPIQRVPRYKLLLEDLAMCTPPREDGPRDTLDDALTEIGALASLMNEEKRDADSRLRLFHWQKRISSRGPSPLVQPHRKLILDGPLHLIRLIKKASAYVEVENTLLGDGDNTIMPSKAIVPVEYVNPEPLDKQMMLILCTDLLVLVSQRSGEGWEGQVDLFNVLRMATVREPASIVHGNVLRVVDNKSIYYFQSESSESVLNWCRAINTARRR